MSTTVGLISLGCAKNLIDSEVMIGHLAQAGMSLTPDPELADVLIINTCSFIDMAKQESIDAIFGAVKDRSEDPDRERQKIIVAGCLSQRFAKDLPGIMPEQVQTGAIVAIRRKTGILGQLKVSDVTAEGAIANPLPGFGPVQPQVGDELILPPQY